MASELEIHMPTEIGDLLLNFKGDRLVSLAVETTSKADKSPSDNNKALKTIYTQLTQYFSSARPFINISLFPQGTSFQKLVWHELSKIPLGEIRTYGEIASKLNTSPRAVGNACRKNPIQIIIPCHRVVSAKGIGGYAGETDGRQLNIKRWLLMHEGIQL